MTVKQIAFVDEYFRNGFNATSAYRKVYGCSYNSARSASARLLNHFPEVIRYLDLIKKERSLQRRKRRLSECRDKRMMTVIDFQHPISECISFEEIMKLKAIRRKAGSMFAKANKS